MAEIEAFCVFCEDVREEPGEKQSWLGVLGGSLFAEPGTDTIKDLSAVCIARIHDRREVDVVIDVIVDHKNGKAMSPGQFKASFTQRENDKTKHWVLNLRVDMGGMPVVDGAVASIKFQVGEVMSKAFLPISLGAPVALPEPIMTLDDNASFSGATVKKSGRKRRKVNEPKADSLIAPTDDRD